MARSVLTAAATLACWCAAAVPGAAQQATPSWLALDTVAAVDRTVDEDGNFTTGVILDAVASANLGRGFEAIVRPLVQRLPGGEWNRQIWIAALRYERRGRVGVRVDAGLIPSPVGLANLTLRPPFNPTIAQPSSLFTPLPPLEPRGTPATLLGAVYAYGGQATLSGEHWDARAAIIDTSPLRTRRIFAESNPPRFATVVIGGGMTPMVGVRVGASVTRGGWQRAGETPLATADRDATIATAEVEIAFRHTKLSGEWTRDAIETSTGTRAAAGWFLQGQQTLAPRWFLAGRAERIDAPAVFWLNGPAQPPLVADQQLTGYEAVLGYRLTPELTLRGGYRARTRFGRAGFDDTVSVSAVWWKRWM